MTGDLAVHFGDEREEDCAFGPQGVDEVGFIGTFECEFVDAPDRFPVMRLLGQDEWRMAHA